MAPPTRIGLAVMGQNLALNIAEKGFPISVYNRTTSKVDETVQRSKQEGNLPLFGFHDPESFVKSIQKPSVIIMLVKAGARVDQTIKTLSVYMEKGDCIIDGGSFFHLSLSVQPNNPNNLTFVTELSIDSSLFVSNISH